MLSVSPIGEGIGMPVAVVVFSSNIDLTLIGGTLFTLRNADPV